jgi:selenophosphate synthetase-related protein
VVTLPPSDSLEDVQECAEDGGVEVLLRAHLRRQKKLSISQKKLSISQKNFQSFKKTFKTFKKTFNLSKNYQSLCEWQQPVEFELFA